MIDGRKQVSVAAVIVAARRQLAPWCAEPNPYVLTAMARLCADLAGVTEEADKARLLMMLNPPMYTDPVTMGEAEIAAGLTYEE